VLAAVLGLQVLLGDEARRPFDLERGPLMRAWLARAGPEDAVLSVTFHHIVVDGWSMDVFARELGELYGMAVRGRPCSLPPLPVQYGDYAVWAAGRERPELAGELARELTGLPLKADLPFASGPRTQQGGGVTSLWTAGSPPRRTRSPARAARRRLRSAWRRSRSSCTGTRVGVASSWAFPPPTGPPSRRRG
jgi:condensation domain-containing protein